MRSGIRHLVILVLAAVLAISNGLSFAAPVTLAHTHPADAQFDIAAHDRTHHAHHGTHQHAQSQAQADVKSDRCLGADCDDSDHSNHPCCHMHAHCCTSLLSLALEAGISEPTFGKGALLIATRASVPLGTMSYPLLRPPRAYA